ncbi:MAG: MATE family efflux transporter [Clostridiales bacterium]|nr:MATE family efflux transporter [Clostridiales bacterium]
MRASRAINILDESVSAPRIIWRLAWPTILEQMLVSIVQYVDTAMVGSLGKNATASIAVTSSFTWLMNGFFSGIAMGFGVPVGRYIGAGKHEEARTVIRQAVLTIFGFGLFATLVMQIIAPFLPGWLGAEEAIRGDASAYIAIVSSVYVFSLAINACSNILRCAGDTRTPLIFNVATNVINVVLNFLFIFPTREMNILGLSFTMPGLGLGVRGAAIATAAACAFSGTMLLRALFRHTFPASISIKDNFRPDRHILADMVHLGSPITFERVMVSLGQITLTALVTSLGTASLAAHSLATTAESIIYMPAFGISVAATALAAQSLGAKRPDLAKRFADYCLIGSVIFMSAMGAVLFFGGEWLVSLFTPDAEVVMLGGKILRIEAFAEPFYGIMMVVVGLLRGARQMKATFIISAIGMWVVRIPLALLLLETTSLGLSAAWVAMFADLTTRGILSLIYFLKGSWLKRDTGTA